MDWGAEPAMSDMEALMWRSEASPRLRSGGVILDILDRAPDWERLQAVARVGGDARAAAARARDRGPAAADHADVGGGRRLRPRLPPAPRAAARGRHVRRRPRGVAGARDGAVRPRAPAVGGGADRGPAGRPRRLRAQAPPLAARRRRRHPAVRHPAQRPPGRRRRTSPPPAASRCPRRARPTGSRARSAASCAARPAAPARCWTLGTDLVLRPEPTVTLRPALRPLAAAARRPAAGRPLAADGAAAACRAGWPSSTSRWPGCAPPARRRAARSTTPSWPRWSAACAATTRRRPGPRRRCRSRSRSACAATTIRSAATASPAPASPARSAPPTRATGSG